MLDSSGLSHIVPATNFPADALPVQAPPSPTATSFATGDDGKTPSNGMHSRAGQIVAKNLYAQCEQGQADVPSAEQLAGQIEDIYKETKELGMFTPRAYGPEAENGELRHSELFQAWKGLNEQLKQAENDPAGKVHQSDEELCKQTDKYKKIYINILTSGKILKEIEGKIKDGKSFLVRDLISPMFLEKSKERLREREQESKELLASIKALPEVPMSSEKIKYIKLLRVTAKAILEDRAWMYRAMAEVPGTFEMDCMNDLDGIEKMKRDASPSSQDKDPLADIEDLKTKINRRLPDELPGMLRGMISVFYAIRLVGEEGGVFEANKNAIKSMVSEAMCMCSRIVVIIEYPGYVDADQTTKTCLLRPIDVDVKKGGSREFFISPEERKEMISRAELTVLAETDYENFSWSDRFFHEFVNIKNWAAAVCNGALGIFNLKGASNELGHRQTYELLVKLAPKLDEIAYNLDVLNADLAETLALYEQRSNESGGPASADSLTTEQGEQLAADLMLRAALFREMAFNYRLYARCLEPEMPAQSKSEDGRRTDVAADEAGPAMEIPAEKSKGPSRKDRARKAGEKDAARKNAKNEAVDKAPPVAAALPVTQVSRAEKKRELDDLLESAEQEVKAAIGQLARHYKAITPCEHDNALEAVINMYIAAASDYADAKKIQSEFHFPDKPDPEKLEQKRLHSHSEAVLLDVYAKHPLSFFEPPDGEALKVLDEAGGMQVCRSFWNYFLNLGTEDDPDWIVENFLRLSATMTSPKVTVTKRMTRIVGFHGHVEDGLTLKDLKFITPDQIRYTTGKNGREESFSHTKLLSQLRVGDEGWQEWRRKGAAQGKEVETAVHVTHGDVPRSHDADSNEGWQVWRPKRAPRRKVATYAHVMYGDVSRNYGAEIIRRGAAATPERIDLGSFTKKF